MANTHSLKGCSAVLVVICGIVLLGAVQLARAQDAATKLDALLERVSFNNAEKPETLGKELAELDAAYLAKLCDMLIEPGTGDDTKPRMALHALTWYLGSAGTAEQRDKYMDALCDALETDTPREVKAFLIRQLQLVGTDRAVPALAKLLSDDDLYADAAQALLAIGGDEAARVFRDALRQSVGRQRVTIIDAIGFLRDGRAAHLLERVFTDDKASRLPAFSALASIGVEGFQALAPGPLPGDSWYGQCVVVAWLLEGLERSAEKGDACADSAAHEFALGLGPPSLLEVHQKCAALYALARVQGADAVGRVVEGMSSMNAELRAAAIETAVRLSGRGVSAAFVDELLTTECSDVQIVILNVLTRRDDVMAFLPAVLALKDESKDVRLAAVEALAALGRETAVEPLVEFVATDEGDERKAAEDALTGLRGDDVPRRIANAIAGQPGRTRALLLHVLARRRAKTELDTIFKFTRAADEDEEVRVSAIEAVGELADETAAAKLLPLLPGADCEPVREALETALAAVCSRGESPAMRCRPIIDALARDNPRDYCSLLRVLGRIGGAPALERLREAVGDPRPDVQEAAIRSFQEWPDATAAKPMLEIARGTKETKYHVLAMRTYARLVGLDADRPAEETLEMYTAGLDAARRPEEKKLLLGKLAEVKHARAFDVLKPYLDDEQLRAEAGSAMIGVARGLLPTGWAPAREALEQVIAEVNDERVRRHAEDVLKEVAEHEDYITGWQVSGPYRQGNKKGNELFDVPFPPEDPDAEDVEWKEQPVTDDPARYWFIDLARSCGGSHPVGYLRTYLWSPKTQQVLLELGSDDGIKVWLNGAVIHANNVPRGCDRAQDKVKTKLNEGWNELLLKITNIGGAWAACARVRAPDGSHLEGLKFDAQRQP